jgi:hypothetical protein
MKLYNKLALLSVVLIFLGSLAVSAAPISIIVRGPSDGSVVTNYRVEFIYGFSQIPDMKNCSLVIDDEVKQTRSDLINFDNNKISQSLEHGEYTWFIRCFDTNNQVLESLKRKITLNTSVDTIDGYEVIYNSNRLRSYVISLSEGQAPIYFPAMKAGEDIRVKTAKTTYYFDIIKMGSEKGVSFVDVRFRPLGQSKRIMLGKSEYYDLEEDKRLDVQLTLEKVERNVNAYFSLGAFPDSPSQETPAETKPEPKTEEEEQVTPQTRPEPEKQVDSKPSTTTTSEQAGNQEASGKSWVWIILILFILAIALVVFFTSKNAKKVQKETKKEEIREEPKKDEKVDIVKSTGSKRKK